MGWGWGTTHGIGRAIWSALAMAGLAVMCAAATLVGAVLAATGLAE